MFLKYFRKFKIIFKHFNFLSYFFSFVLGNVYVKLLFYVILIVCRVVLNFNHTTVTYINRTSFRIDNIIFTRHATFRRAYINWSISIYKLVFVLVQLLLLTSASNRTFFLIRSILNVMVLRLITNCRKQFKNTI